MSLRIISWDPIIDYSRNFPTNKFPVITISDDIEYPVIHRGTIKYISYTITNSNKYDGTYVYKLDNQLQKSITSPLPQPSTLIVPIQWDGYPIGSNGTITFLSTLPDTWLDMSSYLNKKCLHKDDPSNTLYSQVIDNVYNARRVALPKSLIQ
jgi:hypothetical protein